MVIGEDFNGYIDEKGTEVMRCGVGGGDAEG